MNIKTLFRGVAAVCLLMAGVAVSAQQWPEKPVRIIVPYSPGGTIDIVARQLGTVLAESLGQPFIVENRTGAGGIIGTEYVAKQPPDGYTILFTTVSHTLAPAIKKLSFAPQAAFVPVVHIADSPQVLFRHPSLQAESIPKLASLSRSRPGSLNYAHSGNGAPAHIAAELLKSMAKIDAVGIPFKGAGETVIAVVSGQVPLGMASLPAVASFIAAGKVVPLGVSTGARTAALPNVPTFAEQGVEGYNFNTWLGFLAPRGTPQVIVERLAAATNDALRQPEMREKLKTQGADPVGGTPGDFDKFLRNEFESWPDALRKAKVNGDN